MSELLEMLEKTIPEIKNGNAVDKKFWLEKEKQQIKDAWNSAYGGDGYFNSEDYYNENYK